MLSPRDLAEAALARIAETEPALNAFADPMARSARAEADRAGEALRAGHDLGPLHGIPVAIKDLIEVAGAPTGCGSKVEPPRFAAQDATLVARLRAAGAVILGKTNCLEYAYGVPHPEVGQTNNPHDPSRTAGGSSGGSAAAVAAGIVPLSVGTDTGGSIRIPAAYCGIVGMKPSYGLVPLDGVFPLSWSLDHAGPLARRVGDARLLLSVMSGRDMAAPPPGRVRLGVLRRHWPREAVNIAVGACVDAALERLDVAGIEIREIDLPGLGAANATLADILKPEASVIHRDLLARNADGYAPGTRAQVEAGFRVPATVYVVAMRLRDRLRSEVEAVFAGVDALVSPTVPFVAPYEDPPISGANHDDEMLASGFANLTGHPAVSLPCGQVGGLPIGLQLTGALDTDAWLLAVAERCEAGLAGGQT
jgi:aspartyl-tRNA(Asn)/glutamyl-tRNA(Gln) amidotransferase subunit A